MKQKLVVFVIIIIVIWSFVYLVSYGWRHRYGPPTSLTTEVPRVLFVPRLDEKLDLAAEPGAAKVWDYAPGIDVELFLQATERPWPKAKTPAVRAQAYHDGENICFRLSWPDAHADTHEGLGTFPDACAVALSLTDGPPAESIMMGFGGVVNIWHWKADLDAEFWQHRKPGPVAYSDYYYPFEDQEVVPVIHPKLVSPVGDLLSNRPGSLTRKEKQIVQGRGAWKDGRWTVVLKRALATPDPQQDAQLSSGVRAAAFSVWNGGQNDRGGRKSISDWVLLNIESASAPRKECCEWFGRPAPSSGWAGLWHAIRSFSLIPSAQAQPAVNPADESRADTPPPADREIRILAKRFEYNPNKIYLRKGERVTLYLDSLDVVHGFYLDGYELQMKARPGVAGKLSFVADKTGRFTFRCSETCGEFHPYMVGFLVVEPNDRFHLFLAGIGAVGVLLAGVMIFKTPGRKKEVIDVGTTPKSE